MHLSDLPTPQVLIDQPRLMRNIARAQALADGASVRLRPHAKTHKSPIIAKWQIDCGATGICCAKVGEAEVFVDAGINDIRLPYPVNPSNAARVIALADRATISIIVDHLEVAHGWSDAMQRAGRTLDVLVKVDVGFHRCGIDPAGNALEFIHTIASLPGLRLRGLLSHAGHGYQAASEDDLSAIARQEAETLTGLRDRAAASGLALEELSVGATPTLRFSVRQPGLTELRPGNYVYFDRTQVALGAATLDDCALTVLATVVSKPAADRIILDCGSKTLTNDQARSIATASGSPGRSSPGGRADGGLPSRSSPGGSADAGLPSRSSPGGRADAGPPSRSSPGGRAEAGYGAILADHGASPRMVDDTLSIERLSEEHATVRVTGGTALKPGDRVRIVPNHSCVVSNLVDVVRLVEGNTVVDTIPVAARGKIT